LWLEVRTLEALSKAKPDGGKSFDEDNDIKEEEEYSDDDDYKNGYECCSEDGEIDSDGCICACQRMLPSDDKSYVGRVTMKYTPIQLC
jgi:hypothetical protein